MASRKDYLIIAEAFRKELDLMPRGHAKSVARTVRNVANALGRANKKFDTVKFALACGLAKDFSLIPQTDCRRNTRVGPDLGRDEVST